MTPTEHVANPRPLAATAPEPNSQPRVAVVIPAYTMDRWGLLARMVESARSQTVPVETIVVCIDNNETLLNRARSEWSEAQSPEVLVIPNRHHADLDRVSIHEAAHGSRRRFGAGAARNTAAEAVSADVIVFTDDDARAEPDWIERLLEVLSSPAVVAAGGPPIADYETARPAWYPGNFNWVFGCAYDGLPTTIQPYRRLFCGNLAVRRAAFDAVGGFLDSDFDDLNLGTRLIERFGIESLVYTPFAVVHHFVPAERVTWSYFWRRCYFVNREKVRVFSNMGTRGNLTAERRFVIHALSRQVGVTLRRLIRGDINGLYALGAMIVGIGLAGAGHLRGQVDRMMERAPGTKGGGMSR
jgi:glycosyltransferase involved in cell wall biosynthesis